MNPFALLVAKVMPRLRKLIAEDLKRESP